MTANINQKKVIENTDGIIIVDAGAGTGKTHTITQRYLNILNSKVNSSKEILMVTFTKNAAANMKEKVISNIDSEQIVDVIDSPIVNFDSFCFKIVSQNGLNAPEILGIKEPLNQFKLLSEPAIQNRLFSKFYNQFLKKHQNKYEDILVTIKSPHEILSIIEQLLSKGIYPTKQDWFLDSREKLNGNFEIFKEKFQKENEPIPIKNSFKQSKALKNFDDKKQYLDLPEDYIIDKVQINPNILDKLFQDNNEDLINFIQHIYIEYIEFMVKNNLMTFSLISMFAFLILHTKDDIRKNNSFNYILVDEFQDTNEMQFMLILLLLKQPNLCVVGDWKQGIYGFRNATISNILEFKEKIIEYKNHLNKDKIRINFDVSQVKAFEFDINYRSSQKILDFSKQSLITKTSNNEELDIEKIQENIVSLKSEFDYDNSSEIEFFLTKDKQSEIDFILSKIQNLVNEQTITYFEKESSEYKTRKIQYSDIAILSRTRNFGIEIQKRANQFNIPVVYEGGIKLFEEQESILLLAWLKLLLNQNNSSALVTVLEKENYSFTQIKEILESKEIPQNILEFRNFIFENKKQINYIVDEILKKYNFSGPITNSLIKILEDIFNTSLISISDLVLFIEENIEKGQTYNIEIENSNNSVKVQTIHSAKGLEYEIVFIVNCNESNFPGKSSNTNTITFHEIAGLRNKNVYSKQHGFIFDCWKTQIVNKGLFSDNDEERRLLYVAITRAMFKIYFTSNKPSQFFKQLADNNIQEIEEFDIQTNPQENNQKQDLIKISNSKLKQNKIYSVHELMTFKEGQKGRGIEFGNQIHKLAFRYVENLPISKIKKEYEQDFNNIKKFIDNTLKQGKFQAEIDCSLPLENILIRGIIDLVVEFEDKIKIIDWKTDMVKDNLEEYKKQLSLYYHVLKEIYPNKNIEISTYWTYLGEEEIIEPVKLNKLISSIQ